MPKYEFKISDTKNNKVSLFSLKAEIEDALNETDFSIQVKADDIRIFTDLPWSESKQAFLENAVYKHEGVEKRKKYKIASLIHSSAGAVSPYYPPKGIDFTKNLSKQLHKKKYPLVGGRPTTVEYYSNYDVGTGYSDLICKIDFSFEFDEIGLISRKYAWLKFAFEDDTFSENEEDWKNLGKKYDPIRDADYKDQEDIWARQNQYSQLRVTVAGLIAQTLEIPQIEALHIGIGYLTLRGSLFKSWVEDAVREPLILALEADAMLTTHAWLNKNINSESTILSYILSEINYRTV